MGFGSHWRKLIFECLSTSKLVILINGSPSREFSLERGLRQGDPLSPFLFDIVIQGLTVLFDRASASGYFKGLQTAPGHYITHLQCRTSENPRGIDWRFFSLSFDLIGSLESPPSNLLKATRKPDVLVLSEIRG